MPSTPRASSGQLLVDPATLVTATRGMGQDVLAGLPGPEVLGAIRLWSEEEGILAASKLFSTQPALLMVIRRPGCHLCRYQSRELWQGCSAKLKQLGLRLVAVVSVWDEKEITSFRRFWPGEILLDKDLDIFKVLGGGKLSRAPIGKLFNPFSSVVRQIAKAMTSVDGNTVGVGASYKGGVMVVQKGGQLEFMHVEKELGFPASHKDILEAAQKVACVV